jgi:hypothetical protein
MSRLSLLTRRGDLPPTRARRRRTCGALGAQIDTNLLSLIAGLAVNVLR